MSGLGLWARRSSVLALASLVGFFPPAHSAQPAQGTPAPVTQSTPPTRPVATPPVAPTRVTTPAEAAAQRILETQVRELGRGFAGIVGIAVRDVDTGWM